MRWDLVGERPLSNGFAGGAGRSGAGTCGWRDLGGFQR
jgi:hypothetical protein